MTYKLGDKVMFRWGVRTYIGEYEKDMHLINLMV